VKTVYYVLFRLMRLFDARRYRFMDQMYRAVLPAILGECGHNVHIHYPFHITGSRHAHIGNNVHISRGAFIRAEGGLVISDNVHIARNLVLYTINHNYAGTALPYDQTFIEKPVVIGKNVWIGINVTIVPGATIGEGAIIGAGSVVAGDVPPLSIVGSPPLKVLKYRDRDHYSKLEGIHAYGGADGYLYISENKPDESKQVKEN
jgi:acetyltransferase-like isoleucine patch superfamily enzyme